MFKTHPIGCEVHFAAGLPCIQSSQNEAQTGYSPFSSSWLTWDREPKAISSTVAPVETRETGVESAVIALAGASNNMPVFDDYEVELLDKFIRREVDFAVVGGAAV